MSKRTKFYFGLGAIAIVSCISYFSTQVNTVYGGDAGDLLSAIATKGIPHAPGYPLYTSLGILLDNLIPVLTLAKKVAFLSSIPSVLTLLVLFILLSKLIARIFIPLISVLTLGFVYTFFLYSSVVEVFSLNNLFLASLILCTYLFYLTSNLKYLYLSSFIFGLSLAHHHIILFSVPSLIYLTYRMLIKMNLTHIVRCVFLFFSGLTPYLYVYISSLNSPSINWMGKFDTGNFLGLVLRTTYGTFMAGRFVNMSIQSRIVNMFAFFDFIFRDFTPVGVILICCGIYLIYIKNKKLFKFLTILFLSYLFFLFYASFPLGDAFMQATFERFLLPLYIVLTIPLAYGFVLAEQILSLFYKRFFRKIDTGFLQGITLFLFACIPILLFIKNYQKISILKNDKTAENFALDILNTVTGNGILFLSSDTSLFDTQYFYYSRKYRNDVKLIHLSKLYLPFYYQQLNREYNDLYIDRSIESEEDFEKVIKDNLKNGVFSKQSFNLISGRWVPYGLLYKYYGENDKDNPEEIIKLNESLFKSYHDPLSGSLSVYKNMFLSDILKVYLLAHQEIALYEARNGSLSLATHHLEEAKKLDSRDNDSYILLAQVYIKGRKCQEADDEINQLAEIDKKNNIINYLKYLNYSLCYDDSDSAHEAYQTYEKNEKEKEIPLKKL